MSLAERLLALPVEIDGYELERRELRVSSGFTRVSTTVVVHGGGERGHGEDVTYDAGDHDGYPASIALAGSWTLADLSAALDEQALFARPPGQEAAHDYRRWAFESAALDLALRQAGLSLGAALERPYRPVRFVVSTRTAFEGWLAAVPSLEFKLDAEADWDRPLLERLAATDRVRIVDLKAYYRGTSVDLLPDPALYRSIAELLPDVVIEDPSLDAPFRLALAGAEQRLSFDAPIHSLADLDALPLAARWLNVKPSRFGTVRRLFDCLEACVERRIELYGGGQFELGPGRRQIQVLASLFYPDGPNDVAPAEYNAGGPTSGLATSPLDPPEAIGF